MSENSGDDMVDRFNRRQKITNQMFSWKSEEKVAGYTPLPSRPDVHRQLAFVRSELRSDNVRVMGEVMDVLKSESEDKLKRYIISVLRGAQGV